MSPSEFIKEVYLDLIEQGWTLNNCDEMDFCYYLDLLIHRAIKRQEPEATIDQVF